MGIVTGMKISIKCIVWTIFSLMGFCLFIITAFCYYKGFTPIKEMLFTIDLLQIKSTESN